LQLTQVWLLRPGKADLSIRSKGSRKPGTQDYGHQPKSALALRFEERVRESGRLRKATIVALARKLLIALWKYVTLGVVVEGAVMKAA